MLELFIASILSFALGFNVDKILEKKDIVMAIILTIATCRMIVTFVYFMPMMHGYMLAFMLSLSFGIFVSSLLAYEK